MLRALCAGRTDMVCKKREMMVCDDKSQRLAAHLRSAMTLVEMMMAVAIVVIIFAAVLPQFRAIENGWDSREGSAEVIQNGRVLADHLSRNLSKAVKITAVSDSAETDGFIEFEDNDGDTLRYDIDVDNYIEYGQVGSLSDLAGPVSSLTFTCYDSNDFASTTTDGNDIRFVKAETVLTNSASLGQDKTFTAWAYLRTNGSDTGDGELPTMIAYGRQSQNEPRYRSWDGSVWSIQSLAGDVGAACKWLVAAKCPIRAELAVCTADEDADLNIQFFDGLNWTTPVELSTNIVNTTQRPFYIAYEQSSGELLIVYREATPNKTYYRTYDGTLVSGESNVSIPDSGKAEWIRLVPKAGSDEIMMVMLDDEYDVTASVWDGDNWTNTLEVETDANSITDEGISAAYESTSGDAMVVWTQNPSQSATVVEIQIGHDDDDAEEDNGGTMTLNDNDIELGQMKYVGVRFLDVGVPQGSTITNAYVKFRASSNNSEATSLTIYAEDADDAARFQSTGSNISGRQFTSSSVTWNSVPAWSKNSYYETPDISSTIQEVVSRSGFSSGNSIVVIFESTDLNGRRVFQSHDDNPTKAPTLHIEYTTSGNRGFQYRTWNGSVWSDEADGPDFGYDLEWLELAADPCSDQMILGSMGINGSNGCVEMAVWNGSSWSDPCQMENLAPSTDRRVFDVEYNNTGTGALAVWGRSGQNRYYYKTFDGTDWSSEQTGQDIGSTVSVVQLTTDTVDNQIFLTLTGEDDQLRSGLWDGSSFSAAATLVSDMPDPNVVESFMLSTSTGTGAILP